MSTPPAITMPLPDPKYLRPSIDSDSVESRLAQNLLTAVYQNSTELVKFFLSKGAVIDRAVLIAAVWVRSPAIFQALLEHGWDINAPIMGNDTALLYVGALTYVLVTDRFYVIEPFWTTNRLSGGFSTMVLDSIRILNGLKLLRSRLGFIWMRLRVNQAFPSLTCYLIMGQREKKAYHCTQQQVPETTMSVYQ